MKKVVQWCWSTLTARFTDEKEVKHLYLAVAALFLFAYTGLLFLGIVGMIRTTMDAIGYAIVVFNLIGWVVSFMVIRSIRHDLEKEDKKWVN